MNDEIMVPGSTALQEIHHTFHYGMAETATDALGDVEPITEAPCLEPIDDDPTINALLAAKNL